MQYTGAVAMLDQFTTTAGEMDGGSSNPPATQNYSDMNAAAAASSAEHRHASEPVPFVTSFENVQSYSVSRAALNACVPPGDYTGVEAFIKQENVSFHRNVVTSVYKTRNIASVRMNGAPLTAATASQGFPGREKEIPPPGISRQPSQLPREPMTPV